MAVPEILDLLSELAPGGGAPSIDVSEAAPVAWLGVEPQEGYAEDGGSALLWPPPERVPATDRLDRLTQLDALHQGEQLLRLGWVYLVGELVQDGIGRPCCLPLATVPIRVGRSAFGRVRIELTGPWDLLGLVDDVARAEELEDALRFEEATTGDPPARHPWLADVPGLRRWVHDVVDAAGLPDVRIASDGHIDARQGAVRALVGFGVHATRDVDATDLRSSLANWAGTAGTDRTAFARLYLPATASGSDATGETEVRSSLPLTAAQAQAVRQARRQPITVVSGPPGTGKSHLAAAIALDAVSRGERVLMATRSAQAADVLAALLERHPGPDPVLFGGGERAERLARVLGDGLASPPPRDDAALAASTDEVEALTASVDAALAGVAAAARYRLLTPQVPGHRRRSPRWFEPGADLVTAAEVLDRARRTGGLFGRWRAGRAARSLRAGAGAPPSATVDELATTLDVARTCATASTSPGTVGDELWAALEAAEVRWRDESARHLGRTLRAGVDADARRAVAALAGALRAGRARRRRHLRGIEAGALTDALPLWVGTLRDIEELLPAVPAMFDLVILDEASQIDQVSAAPALLRSGRTVVVGDPRQLRFVSFVPDRAVAAAVAARGLDGLADRLDVRRVSAFDLAAGASPVTFLDEHFRSVPHLIGFSARRFYDGRLLLATRHPATESARRIDVRRVAGTRDDSAVNRAEVEAVATCLEEVLAGGDASVGVVSPFRGQADALEEMIRERVDVDRIRASSLRVGTVHAFQGDERDVMIVSFAFDGGHDGLAFVEDPNLFNVLVTRARRAMVVVVSTEAPRVGLLADYLRWAEVVPRPGPSAPAEGWTGALARALAAGGAAVRTGYPVGRWSVDLCVGTGADAVAVECEVHPDGFAAHRARHLALRRAGWRVVDAFADRFDADPAAAAVSLATMVRGRPGIDGGQGG